ncbi:hypothetical protein [Streptomyces resistomycificus]|uniref:Uncharacterized protein n=1 Tax=Streptomyces resistomycificus TaxID=67356 RepID=A0A0L8KXM8_9ACTN|nr:hypothetical protein [Streptomyces resistomycificus]KOG30615.1 hypothetical protein ADK37_34325 [Streptomyces resistomycificus]KUO02235.1 hypothetical protein AQJ84_00765 [Streptomyces resistomycificus]
MTDPVFVIHGVGNRDRDGFEAAVTGLQKASGTDLVPVYWGDLGADDAHFGITLPTPPDLLRDDVTVGTGPVPDTAADGVEPEIVDVRQQWPHVEAGARERVEGPELPDDGLRAGPGAARDPEPLLDLVARLWPDTHWLSRTRDPALLHEVGAALADVLTELDPDASYDPYPHAFEVRSRGDEEERLRSLVRRRLSDLDRVAGAAIQATARRVNHALRSRVGPATTRFVGDVLVYQRHQAAVHARVRAALDAVDPGIGRGPDRPARIAAHSLGGVIAVDMATAEQPLWTESLLTFGSQSALFHVCDPRGGQLTAYDGRQPVSLPPTLRRWTNLWEPLDVLAFAAARLYRLHDGTAPVDVPVPHLASAGLWTHSAYWAHPEVAAQLAAAMAPRSG